MTEATPAAAPAAPAAEPSLVDAAAPAAAPAAPAAAPAAPAAAPAAEPPKWYLADKVAGNGDPPEWFKADKYKSVDEQAKAYTELEKRLGAFTGAPKDGVYAVKIPDGFVGEFDTTHPLFQELNTWAKENQFSQKAYDGIIGMLARYEASMVPDMNEIKKELGENADARINSLNQFAKSNLSEEEYQAFRQAQTQTNAASVFKVMEALVAKTKAPALPKPGADNAAAVPGGLEEINALQAAKDPATGKRKYDVDPKYRAEVEKKRFEFFKAAQA